jgi:hypothetical protein
MARPLKRGENTWTVTYSAFSSSIVSIYYRSFFCIRNFNETFGVRRYFSPHHVSELFKLICRIVVVTTNYFEVMSILFCTCELPFWFSHRLKKWMSRRLIIILKSHLITFNMNITSGKRNCLLNQETGEIHCALFSSQYRYSCIQSW